MRAFVCDDRAPPHTNTQYNRYFANTEAGEKILYEDKPSLHKSSNIKPGKMYVTQFAVYFYSKKIVGQERVFLTLPYADIEKTKSNGMINNALRFILQDESHYKLAFPSGEARDLAWDWIDATRQIGTCDTKKQKLCKICYLHVFRFHRSEERFLDV